MDHIPALAALFRETARAHHAAYIDTDGAHPDWPLWYAERLAGPIEERLALGLTISEVVHFLVEADRRYRAEGPSVKWPEYYAAFLIGGYGQDRAT
jgi:hypothetical protein